jgi:phage terminase large subunit-like protein
MGDKPFLLEDWEAAFIEDVFAAIAGNGVKEVWLVVPEGNGKSTLVALLVLYVLEFTPDASIPIAASARDQAEIIYKQASGFERRSAHLAGRFKCKPGLREITFDDDARLAKIFASDAGTGDGIIPYPLEVLDELHRHKNLELYRTWAGKLDKEDAVLVVISTAGEPGSDFEDVRESMRQDATEVTVEGCFGRYVGPTSVLHEYAVPEDGNVEDLELVKAANPSSRITVKSLAAKRSRPSFYLPHWRRLTCNMPTRSESAAIPEKEWYAAVSDEPFPEGQSCWLGLDLGWIYDTTAMVPLWIRDPKFRLFGPATILEPPRDGTQLDAHLIEAALRKIHARNPIHTVVMDMTKGEQLSQWITETLGAEVVNRSQSNTIGALDYEKFMEALRLGWLKHTGDAGLTKHVLNAVGKVLPGGDIVFARPRQARKVNEELQRRRVIDALDAAAFAHTTAAASIGVKTEPVFAWG